MSQTVEATSGSTIRDVIQAVVSGQVTGDVHIGDKVYTRSDLEELNDYLARAVAAFEARMYRYLASAAPPDQPYKFLYAFEIEDADIFFGRDAAAEILHRIVLKDRLTVLHARSGAGKTSLLNAGLSPRLIREGRLPVYARAYEDPVRAVKRAVAPPSLRPWPELLKGLTLHEFLGLACAYLSQAQELVVILDQFEEFFIFWPEKAHRQPFINALGDCCDDPTLPVRFVIGIRGDYFTHLATLQDRLPHVFHNEYYLEAMARDEARGAITGPVARLPQPVAYEPALLDTLLDDLIGGGPALSVAEGMELPHLQIVCTRLYEALSEGETEITLDGYEELGRAKGILSGYLKGELAKLSGRQGHLAREVLKELVSSEATKRVLSYKVLAARIETDAEDLDWVLAWLVDQRLLHRDEDEGEGEIRYEMAHEYLIEEIKGWIEPTDLALKQAQEMLAGEVATWRRSERTLLIPRDRLELLFAQRERFRGLDYEAWECILRSALEADFAVVDWAAIAGDRGQKVLQAALKNGRQEIRLAALQGLGAVWGMPEVPRLGNESQDVRQEAARALGQIGDARTVGPLIATLWDGDSNVRRVAAEALGQIGAPAVEPLIAALGDEDSDVRWGAAKALGQIGAPAVEPLIAALRDADSGVRRSAARALGQIGDARAVEPFVVALRDADRDVRWAAAKALGQIGDARTVEPLIVVLGDGDSGVRGGAAEALGQIGDACALEPLSAALRDEHWSVRQSAVEALGQIDEPRALEPLIAALRDADSFLRPVAAEALGQIGMPAVGPLIAALRDAANSVRRSAVEALGQIGDARAVEPLSAALRDGDSSVRRRAAEALGQIGDARAVEPLSAALGDRGQFWRGKYYVQETAAEALKKIGTPEALTALEEWRQRRK